MIVLASEGRQDKEIALMTLRRGVARWHQRFIENGLTGIEDPSHRGFTHALRPRHTPFAPMRGLRRSSLLGLPYLSNFYYLPGRAGGPPRMH
jgi:hypothetical protein